MCWVKDVPQRHGSQHGTQNIHNTQSLAAITNKVQTGAHLHEQNQMLLSEQTPSQPVIAVNKTNQWQAYLNKRIGMSFQIKMPPQESKRGHSQTMLLPSTHRAIYRAHCSCSADFPFAKSHVASPGIDLPPGLCYPQLQHIAPVLEELGAYWRNNGQKQFRHS